MNHALRMGVIDCASELRDHLCSNARAMATVAANIRKAAASSELHTEIRQTIRTHPNIINWQNIWMIEARRRRRFTMEARERLLRVAVIGKHPFESNYAPARQVPGAVNHSHPATPNLLE